MSNVEVIPPRPTVGPLLRSTAVRGGLWCLTLWGTLSLSGVRSRWSGLLCGPWGCTAPLEAVVACHLSWLVMFAPVVVLVDRVAQPRRMNQLGTCLLLLGLVGAMVLAVQETLRGLPDKAPYVWQRIALEVFGAIDYPVVPCLIGGVTGLALSRRRKRSHCGLTGPCSHGE